MPKKNPAGPLDTLGATYENMYEHVAENLHKIKDKTGPALHELVDEAKDKAHKLDDLTEEDLEKVGVW